MTQRLRRSEFLRLALAALLGVPGCKKRAALEARLEGVWQSDADATIAEIRKARSLTAEQEAALRKLFGKMKITWKGNQATSDLEGTVSTEKVEFLKKERDRLVLKSFNSFFDSFEEFEIKFMDENTYWVYGGLLPASGECFRRVK